MQNPLDRIRLDIDKIKLQADNLLSFGNNPMNPFMNSIILNEQLEDQLISLGIQMINTGIQTIKSLNYPKYFYKYQEQYKNISEEIKRFSIQPEIFQQQIMMQQIMMHQMAEQMQQQQQMMQQQQMNIPRIQKVNVPFKDSHGNFLNLVVDKDTTIEELYEKYMEKMPLYGNDKKYLKFAINGKILRQNDKTKIKDYFQFYINSCCLPDITVYFANE